MHAQVLTPPNLLTTSSIAELIKYAQNDCPVVLKTNMRDEAQMAETMRWVSNILGAKTGTPRAFSEIRKITPVQHTTNTSVALSSAEHDAHTDGTFEAQPPKYFLLGCITPDTQGGISLFWPALTLLESLTAAELQLLKTRYVAYARSDDSGTTDEWVGHMLESSINGWNIRWRYDHQVKPRALNDNDGQLAAVIEKISNQISTLSPIQYHSEAGDIVLVPNQRWLHGRTPLSGNSRRLMLRCWIA